MKKITFLLLSALFLAILFQACQKNESFEEKTKNSAIKVQNGRLSFENTSQFKQTFDLLMKNQNLEYLIKWESQFQNFTSMKTAYNKINEDDMLNIAKSGTVNGYKNFIYLEEVDGEKQASIISVDPILTRIFNKEGLVIIGKDAFKLEKDRILTINNYSEEKLQNVLKGDIGEAKITKLNITRFPSSFINAKPNGTYDWSNSCHDVYIGNRAFKVTATLIENTNLNLGGPYHTMIAVSQHRKQTLGIWFANSTPLLNVSYNLIVTPTSGPQQNLFYTTSQNNSSEVSNAFPFPYGYSYVSGSFTSNGTGVDGQPHGCSVYR